MIYRICDIRYQCGKLIHAIKISDSSIPRILRQLNDLLFAHSQAELIYFAHKEPKQETEQEGFRGINPVSYLSSVEDSVLKMTCEKIYANSVKKTRGDKW